MKLACCSSPPAIVAADGQWATLRQGLTCEAASRSLGVIHKDRPPARASLSFDGEDRVTASSPPGSAASRAPAPPSCFMSAISPSC